MFLLASDFSLCSIAGLDRLTHMAELVSVIIPVFNEENFIEEVIERVLQIKLNGPVEPAELEVIVVNDGSTDDTAQKLERYNGATRVRIFHHPNNRGKAAAVQFGLNQAAGDIFIIQDADLECVPEEIPALLAPVLERRASIVYGSRFKGSIVNMSRVNRLANLFSTFTINFLFGSKLSDMNTCYKIFRREVLKGIEITSNHFAFDAEITAKLLRRKYDILELPIGYRGRSASEGKKMNWLRALEVYWGIFRS